MITAGTGLMPSATKNGAHTATGTPNPVMDCRKLENTHANSKTSASMSCVRDWANVRKVSNAPLSRRMSYKNMAGHTAYKMESAEEIPVSAPSSTWPSPMPPIIAAATSDTMSPVPAAAGIFARTKVMPTNSTATGAKQTIHSNIGCASGGMGSILSGLGVWRGRLWSHR